MVVYSISVQRVLDRICWQDFGETGRFSNLYYECVSAINDIPSSCMTIIANRPFNWVREKGTIIKVRHLWFLYKKFSNGLIVIQEVYDAKRNEILTENKQQNIDTAIKPILEFQERLSRI